MASRYESLRALLARQPPGATVTLTLAQLEALTGGPLPAGARRSAFWTRLAGGWGAGRWAIRVTAQASPAVVVFVRLAESLLESMP